MMTKTEELRLKYWVEVPWENIFTTMTLKLRNCKKGGDFLPYRTVRRNNVLKYVQRIGSD
jgi:hypothetical protein